MSQGMVVHVCAEVQVMAAGDVQAVPFLRDGHPKGARLRALALAHQPCLLRKLDGGCAQRARWYVSCFTLHPWTLMLNACADGGVQQGHLHVRSVLLLGARAPLPAQAPHSSDR